jgi:hypothetical protein
MTLRVVAPGDGPQDHGGGTPGSGLDEPERLPYRAGTVAQMGMGLVTQSVSLFASIFVLFLFVVLPGVRLANQHSLPFRLLGIDSAISNDHHVPNACAQASSAAAMNAAASSSTPPSTVHPR